MAVLSVLSFTILIVTSVLLLIVASRAASRHGETLRWEGVITILLTAGVLLISYLPKSVIIVTMQLGVEYSNTTSRVSHHLTSLNIMANFFVYSLTVQSFRNFLKTMLSEFLSLIGLHKEDLNPIIDVKPIKDHKLFKSEGQIQDKDPILKEMQQRYMVIIVIP